MLLFGAGALLAVLLGLLFAAAAAVSLVAFSADKSAAYVLPAAAGLWLALGWYLLMLGLIAETALGEARAEYPEPAPLAH